MNKRWRFAIFILLLFSTHMLWATFVPKTASDVDFEVLSGKETTKGQRVWKFLSKRDRLDISLFAEAFAQNFPLAVQRSYKSGRSKIPKILHFIWMGPKVFPEKSIANLLSWKELHPKWKMLFWTDSWARSCPIEGMEKHLVDEINVADIRSYVAKTTNYGEKSDLFRYALLWERGGVYVDHDVYCLQAFDRFNEAFDFYAGLDIPHRFIGTGTCIFPSNCLIGAKKGHPILSATIQHVKERWNEIEGRFSGDDSSMVIARVINRTFHSFTLGTKQHFNKDDNIDIVFPSCFFFADHLFAPLPLKRLQAYGLLLAQHQIALSWVK
jgi:mannosyltransferase OCH1-like enzyme